MPCVEMHRTPWFLQQECSLPSKVHPTIHFSQVKPLTVWTGSHSPMTRPQSKPSTRCLPFTVHNILDVARRGSRLAVPGGLGGACFRGGHVDSPTAISSTGTIQINLVKCQEALVKGKVMIGNGCWCQFFWAAGTSVYS